MRSLNRRGRAIASSRLAHFVAEMLEQRTLFTGDIPAGYTYLETLTINNSLANATTSATLAASTKYWMKASGSFEDTLGGQSWDAEYLHDSSNTLDVSSGTTDTGVKVSGQSGSSQNPRWGSYSSSHDYSAYYLTGGSAAALTLSYRNAGPTWTFPPPSGSITIDLYAPAPVSTPPPSGGGAGISGAASGSNGGQSGYEGISGTGVRFMDGANTVGATDLLSDGFGTSFGITRTWTSSAGFLSNSRLGNGWVISQMPYVQSVTGSDTVAVVLGTGAVHYFDKVSGSYVPRFYDSASLSNSSGEFIYSDSEGNVIRFDDFTNATANKRGQFKKLTDVGGNVTEVPASGGYTGDGKIAKIQRSSGSGSTTNIESFDFTYNGDNLISNIALTRSTNNGGSWTTIRQADYGYYGTGDGNGNQFDLKSVTIKDGSGSTIDTHYYRYYTADSATAYQGGMKGAFGPAAVARITADLGNPLSTSITDANIDDYADNWYEYDSFRRVTKNRVKGAGASGLGDYTYSYTTSSNSPGVNAWSMKTTETRPDSSVNIVYTNAYAQPMLKVHKPSAASSTKWCTFFKYDANARLVLQANPSAISGYDDTKSDLLSWISDDGDGTPGFDYLSNSAGLVQTNTFYSSTTATTSSAGGVAGWEEYTKIQLGENGTAQPQTLDTYLKHDAGGTSVYVPAATTRYRSSGGADAQATTFSYTWQGSTHLVESMTISYPTVSSSQNGPGSADSEVLYFDSYGRITFTKDADGFINATEYDNFTGAITKTILDVNTTTATNEPSGWTTPSGGGQHLTTTIRVDTLGRPTKIEDPNTGSDSKDSYIVYKDTDHEVRTYPGWTGSATTGPTTVVREDRANGYVESFTMTATPSTSGGEPTGTESPSSLQTLSRSHFSIGGQLTDTRRFFSLPTYSTSASLGTENTHYYKTTFGYDSRGRGNRTLVPTGTIYRTVYDELSRPVSSWVGTVDSPTSGTWSPSNLSGTNTVIVGEYEYDSGGIGDSNITKITSHPSAYTGGTPNADDRVVQNWYDWRNRIVATKGGVQSSESASTQRLLNYYDYNNLGQVTTSRTFDADNVTISTATSGVPDVLSSSLLRAKQTFDYDDQGRLYASHTFSVDPSSGSVSTYSLNSYVWYDKRGNAIKTLAPGGLVGKSAYDGAGRLSRSYSTDGGGDAAAGASGNWTDAGSVSGDKVLEQADYSFDANGNLILSTARQRFHDDTLTGQLGDQNGQIGGSGTYSKGRVSYVSYYYDTINRITKHVAVGTNGGSSYSRPSTAGDSDNNRSDTRLVTSYDYSTQGWLNNTTDPRGLVTLSEFDAAGRTTTTYENYVNGTPSGDDDRKTVYTHDGMDHVLTLKAYLDSTNYQETKYVYDSTASGNDVKSMDVLTEIWYPNKSTGAASSSEKEVFAVNALGEQKTFTDRNGNVHAYVYDVLGRLTDDKVTTLGSGVDDYVQMLSYAYNTQGLLEFATSYSDTAASTVRNQVQREYNGLGQITKEYQAHSGSVNTSTTPKVQYHYSEMPSGANHSRLTKMTYPNGRILRYEYTSGLDNDISRLSYLADDSSGSVGTHLEEYTYLGLASVIERNRPQPGTLQTYVKDSGDTVTGDAGDQYKGLDRFGRIIDQRWIKVGTGDTDRFKYAYDRNSNALYRDNVMTDSLSGASDLDELYHVDGASAGYDGFNRLTAFQRGKLSDANSDGIKDTVSTEARSQSWSLDQLGNWSSVTTNGTPESRTHNRQNQVTANGGESISFDDSGNLTQKTDGFMTYSRDYVYDAWNRLVKYDYQPWGAEQTTNPIERVYRYDALNRKQLERTYFNDFEELTGSRDLFWTVNWQVIEEKNDGPTEQWVYSPLYVDSPILRDRDYDQSSGNGLEERRYAQHDANFNTTSITNASGAVQERFLYDSYGAATSLNASWSVVAEITGWKYKFQGARWDSAANLYDLRFRDYDPSLGRFLENDPIRQGDGPNMYQFVHSNPVNWTDPSGLKGGPFEKLPAFRDRGLEIAWDEGDYLTVVLKLADHIRIAEEQRQARARITRLQAIQAASAARYDPTCGGAAAGAGQGVVNVIGSAVNGVTGTINIGIKIGSFPIAITEALTGASLLPQIPRWDTAGLVTDLPDDIQAISVGAADLGIACLTGAQAIRQAASAAAAAKPVVLDPNDLKRMIDEIKALKSGTPLTPGQSAALRQNINALRNSVQKKGHTQEIADRVCNIIRTDPRFANISDALRQQYIDEIQNMVRK